MKKFSKLLALPLLALFLVACGDAAEQETTTETTPTEETSSVVESESEAVSETAETSESADTAETTETESDMESETAEETDSEEADETAVTISLIISGDEETIGEFTVADAEGMSVMEAMESVEDLTFTFNEEEGVIDVIQDIENDYEAGNTWVYLLNDQMAELGVVSQTLSAGDNIKWYYGSIDDIPITIIPAEDEEAVLEEQAEEETVEQVIIEEDGE